MNPKDSKIKDINHTKLIHNNQYYQDIFKKTEKIVSVVFYILNNIAIDKKSETHTSNLASKAHFTHENALRTLEVKPAVAKEVLEQFAQSLIGLDSTLRIVSVAHVISAEAAEVITAEINNVLRNLSVLIKDDDSFQSILFPEVESNRGARAPLQTANSSEFLRPAKSKSKTTTATNNPNTDRRTRIATILEAKSEATIKDISDIVSDVSEKTIQRELNGMIEEGIVLRQGERRWSRYSLAS